MGLAIFENYSQSTEGTKYAPLLVSATQMRTFDIVCQWVKGIKTDELEINKDFFEIFYREGEYEITVSITSEGDDSLINASVLGPRGKTRKKLINLLQEIMHSF